MKRPTKADKEWVDARVDHYQRVLFMDSYSVNVVFETGPHDEDDDEEAVPAACRTHPNYRAATVCIYPEFWTKEWTEEKRERVLVHELCHVITAQLWELLSESRRDRKVAANEAYAAGEAATDWIAAIVYATQIGKT